MNTRPRIVILDDDDNVRSVMHLLVREAVPSADIVEEASAASALQHIQSSWADLLITDCNMPEMDGPELVRFLRGKKYSIPIIMVSGNPEAEGLIEGIGVDRFVPKTRLEPELRDSVLTLLPVPA